MTGKADELYLCEQIRERLARDPSVGALSLTVETAGGRIYLTGSVPTEERRRAAGEVARALSGPREVVNEVTVVAAGDPGQAEHLR